MAYICGTCGEQFYNDEARCPRCKPAAPPPDPREANTRIWDLERERDRLTARVKELEREATEAHQQSSREYRQATEDAERLIAERDQLQAELAQEREKHALICNPEMKAFWDDRAQLQAEARGYREALEEIARQPDVHPLAAWAHQHARDTLAEIRRILGGEHGG